MPFRPGLPLLVVASVLGLLLFPACGGAAEPAKKRVVIVVMDGLRPDSVVPADMPNLSKLAREGTFFANHHPVYPSTTEVNGASLATGMYPGRSGVLGNAEYRPEVEPTHAIGMDDPWAIWKGDQASGGKWVGAQTLPEMVRASGGRTAIAGTKGVAVLWDRLRAARSVENATIFAGETIPTALQDDLFDRFGPFPPAVSTRYFTNAEQDSWTTAALVDHLWRREIPDFSLLWLSEPDYAQHATGPGAKVPKEALKSSDDRLGKVLAALEARGVRATTDVIVVSDHGFSTVAQGVDVTSDLRTNRIDAASAFLEKPARGTIVTVPLGGLVAFYAVDRDVPAIERLVRHLQGSNYAGVIFSRTGIEGTFKSSDIGIDAPTAPDVVMALRWAPNTPEREGGMSGIVFSEGGYTGGMGMHGTLARADMRNTLIAAGPSFKAGHRSELPSGNADVAPTVARILGLTPPQPMDGRVLVEALAGSTEVPTVTTETKRASRALTPRAWQQYLKISRVGNSYYLDEGNAGAP